MIQPLFMLFTFACSSSMTDTAVDLPRSESMSAVPWAALADADAHPGDALEPDIRAETAASEQGQSSDWTRVRPRQAFVSVRLPKNNDDESGVRDTIVGDIEHTTISADPTENVDVSITVTELPTAVTMFTTNEMLLRKAKRELLKANSGDETGWGAAASNKKEGRTLHYGTSDGRDGRAELYIDDGVLVVLNAIYPSDELQPAKTFFGSKSFH